MTKLKKQCFGLLGLGLVAIMTIAAYNVPTLKASATSTSTDVEVRVLVEGTDPEIKFFKPLAGSVIVGPNVPVTLVYANISTVNYTVERIYMGTSSSFTLSPLHAASAPNVASGAHDFDIINGYGKYVINAVSTDNGTVEDSTWFRHVPADINVINPGDPNKPQPSPNQPEDVNPEEDPIANIKYDDNVCSVHIQAYNKLNNHPLFNPELVYNIPSPRPAENIANILLPFKQYNAQSSDYTIQVTAFGCGASSTTPLDDPIKKNYTHTAHSEEGTPSPEVPNTGMITIAGLNISRSDYLFSGLIIFGASISLALFIIRRRRKSSR